MGARSEQALQERLTALHEVTLQLTRAGDLDELCRLAVELGRARLGFDRLSIWLAGDRPHEVVGTYGTDEQGATRDERSERSTFQPDGPAGDFWRGNIRFWRDDDVELWDARRQPVGWGTKARVALWDGRAVIGVLYYDNLLTGQALTALDEQILQLFGDTVGHLCALKRSERERLATEARSRSIIDSIPVGMHVWRLDPDGRLVLVDANRAAGEILGVDHTALLGQDLETALPALRDHHLVETYRAVAASGVPWHGEEVIHSEAGMVGAFDVYVFRVAPGLVVAAFLEITQRKLTELALTESERRYRTLVENVSDIIFAVDRRGVMSYVSPLVRNVTGYEPAQLLGRPVLDLVHPDDRAETEAAMQRVLRDGEAPRGHEFRLQASDGRWLWLSSRLAPLVDEQGVVAGGVGVARDMTARRRSQEQLARLATAVDQARYGVIITDAEGRVQYLNPAFAATIGRPVEAVLGHEAGLCELCEDDPFFLLLREAVRTGEDQSGRLTIPLEHGVRYEDVMITAVRHSDGRVVGFTAVRHDVTQQVLAEERMREATKLEAVGQLAGGIAHEFNNLLTAIGASAHFVLAGLSPESPLIPDVEQILRSVDRAAQLTRQLLAFSRRQVIMPRVLDLNETVTAAKRLVEGLLGEDVELRSVLTPDLPPVVADPGQVEQVILNLVVNARDAMPAGGCITIATGLARVEPDAPVGELSPGEYVTLTVSDTGRGIPVEHRAHIFEPFFTTKEVGRGTGLGLATVYGIVAQSGGAVTFDSQIGVGTSFCIYLPLAPPGEKPATPAERPVEVTGGRGLVLLAEDEPSVRRMARRLLTRLGYDVVEVADGRQALERLRNGTEAFDLVITDLMMPGMNGRELADRLAASHPDLPVLFMSGHGQEVLQRHGLDDGEVAFIAKPFTPHELDEAVRRAMRRGDRG